MLPVSPVIPSANESISFADGHLAATAIESKGQASAVVEEEQRTCGAGALVDGAETEFVADAIACAHKFRATAVSQLVGVLGALVKRAAQGVGDVVEIRSFQRDGTLVISTKAGWPRGEI